MRVLLTGAAGFIGGAIRRTLAEAGHDLVLVDVLLPQAHRVPPSVEGLHVLDVRDAADWADLLDGVDAVCHQAALVGAGTTVSDLPAYAAHNDLGTAALLAAMADRERAPPGAGLLDGGLRRGPVRLSRARRRRSPATVGRGAGRRRLRQPLPVVRPRAGLGAGRRVGAARPAQLLRRRQGRPGALHVRVGQAGRLGGGRAEVPQRVRAGHAPRHAVLRCRRDLPLLAGARRGAAGLRGRGAGT